jgi:adenine deaminase
MQDRDYAQRTAHLIDVALGREKAHLAVLNATLANVYTGEFLDNQAICVWDRWIAYVGQQPERCIGPDTEIIDAAFKPVIPGLIDGHTHTAMMYTADAFLGAVIPGGTTAIVTETSEPYVVCGCRGVEDFMDAFADQPIHVFGTAPPMVSISSNFPPIDLKDLRRLLTRSDMIGLGESYWQKVVDAPDQMLPVLETALSMGQRLEGHSAGARDARLNAYTATGISSCHEPIKAEEALERLRLGLYVMIREGSIRRDLAEIAALRETDISTRRMILVTDGLSAGELLEKGYMEYVVQKAIDCGFSPMQAIQMATLNPATHFNLDRIIGGIAPGCSADMVILPDVRTIRPDLVIAKGRIVAENGRCLVHPRRHRFRSASLDSVHLPEPVEPMDFRIEGLADAPQSTLRVIDMITDLVSREAHITLPVVDGEIKADTSQDIIKVAAIDRTTPSGRKFVGLIRGLGLKSGAMATSTSWDTGDLVVVGASDVDMAAAVNRLHALKGGVVVCRDGVVIAELALPVFGLLSHLPLQDLVEQEKALTGALRALGFAFRDPALSVSTLTGAAIPFLRICEQGLVNLKSGPCPLIVS